MLERFPEIAFALSFLANDTCKQSAAKLHDEDTYQEVKEWTLSLDLKNIDVLVIYGLGSGCYFDALKDWLFEDKQRKVVFLEDNLAVINECAHKRGADFFLNAQLYLHYSVLESVLSRDLEQIAFTYPGRKGFTALKAYQNRAQDKKLGELLERAATLHAACLADALQQPHLFQNFYTNISQIPQAFFANGLRGRFKNIPAIICGAGPSLNHAFDTLKKLENRALIVGGGSAITALTVEGIMPHLALACDPTEEEYHRLREARFFENCFIFTSRLFAPVRTLFNGRDGYLYARTRDGMEMDLYQKWGLEKEAIGKGLERESFSVTTQVVALLTEMGCSPIIFVGMDLSFQEGKSYARGIEVKNEDQFLGVEREGMNGESVLTSMKWIIERDAIDAYVKNHPEVTWKNCTQRGLGFNHIPHFDLEEVFARECLMEHDLQGLLWTEIERNRMSEEMKTKLQDSFGEMRESLLRMDQLVDEWLDPQNEGKRIVLEMELQQEIAFKYLFKNFEIAYEHING